MAKVQQKQNSNIVLPWQVGVTQPSAATQEAVNKKYQSTYEPTPLAQAGKTAQPTPSDRYEWTTGWYNYNLDRQNWVDQQWQWNALNGTGHVAWLSYQAPQAPVQPKQWERLNMANKWNLRQPQVAQPTNTQPTNPVKVWWNNGTVQPTVSTPNTQPQQPQGEDLQSKATPDEFWFNNLDNQQEQQTQQNTAAYTNGVMQNMQADLWQSTAWQLYGKVWADTNGSVQTLQDANSVFTEAAQGRMNMVKSIISQDPYNIATLIASGSNPYWDMAMRDVMQYAPEFYKQIQAEVKKIQWWETANAIASGGKWPDVTWTATNNTNSWVDSWAKWVSSSPLQTSDTINNISNSMSNNQVATTATQEMLNINKQIAEYNEKLNNLESEARAAFKGDVPQYIVNAYMANRRQQYQSEINKLEDRYNSAMDLYKTELSNAQWQEEMNLKYLKYQQDINNDAWTRYYQTQTLAQNAIKWVDGKAYQVNGDGTFTQLTDATSKLAYNDTVNSALQGYMWIFTSWWATKTANGYKYNVSGGQCETFTDNFTEATTWLRMTWENGRWWTTAAEKMSYINSFTPEVWSVAIWVGWAYDSTYWHTMLVTWYDPTTWIVDLLWSNKDGDEMVYSTSAKLTDLQAKWLRGFRNPYMDVAKQNTVGNYMYEWFNTPMAQAFERISSDSSLSMTQRNALPIALEMYDTMYEIANNWQLDALVENWDLALILNDFKNKKFSNADKGEKFLDAFTKALNNKAASLVWGDNSYSALMALQRLIEAKLRDESWAAISSSEWMTNFSYLLPQAWENYNIKNEKLKSWDRIISTKFITAWGKMSEYVPIFQDDTVREIWGY